MEKCFLKKVASSLAQSAGFVPRSCVLGQGDCPQLIWTAAIDLMHVHQLQSTLGWMGICKTTDKIPAEGSGET